MNVVSESATRARQRVGSVLKDKWHLDELIGVGGMAAVYSATHKNRKRVAVKILLAEVVHDPEVRSRFVREGYVANTIEHPGAVSVLDDDVTDDGAPFLVMDLLEGETVDARWARGGNRMDPAEALGVAIRTLDVLTAAHAKGVVHRDIKPENLFFTRDGGLKVLDFGIARLFEQTASKKETRQGVIMGTPAFMAPEQALAKWDEVDGRTDLWAVGATLFTLITGKYVHEGSTGTEQLVKSATTPAPGIMSVMKVPRSLAAVVDRALAFQRTQRWPDARAMQDAARGAYEALTGKPFDASQPAAAQSAMSSGERPALTSQGQIAAAPRTSQGNIQVGGRPSQGGQRTASGEFRAPIPTTPEALDAFLAARSAERDAAAIEVARATPVVTEINARLTSVRRRLAELEGQIAGVRKEQQAEEEKFRRQTSTRMEGVGEAKKDMRRALGAFAQAAMADTATFGVDFNSLRENVAKARGFSMTRTRELGIHESAITSFDPKSLKIGIGVAAAFMVALVLLFVLPVALRGCGQQDDTGTLAPPP